MNAFILQLYILIHFEAHAAQHVTQILVSFP